MCAALLTLCGPFTPMLFQGEEWAATTPFQFFTSHPEEELGRAVAEGRTREFAEHGWDPDAVPDPQDPATYERSLLDWSERDGERGQRVLTAYRELARLRRELPELTDPAFAQVRCTADEAARFFTMRRGGLTVLVNFGDEPMATEVGDVELLFETEVGRRRGRRRAHAAGARRRAGQSWLRSICSSSAGASTSNSSLNSLKSTVPGSSPTVRSILTQVVLALDQHVAGRGALLVGLLDRDHLLAVELLGAGDLVLAVLGGVAAVVAVVAAEDVVEEGVEVAELREARVVVDDPLVADGRDDRVRLGRGPGPARTPRPAGTSSGRRRPAAPRCRPRSRWSRCSSPRCWPGRPGTPWSRRR